jgi:quaternary ammonium compound-resistance protein SugE
MPWILVLIAGCFEIVFAVSLKYCDGFTKFGWTALALASGAISFVMLTFAMKSLSAGTAYAVWTGIGAAGTVIVGVLWLGDPHNPGRIVSVTLVIAGIIGLKLAE